MEKWKNGSFAGFAEQYLFFFFFFFFFVVENLFNSTSAPQMSKARTTLLFCFFYFNKKKFPFFLLPHPFEGAPFFSFFCLHCRHALAWTEPCSRSDWWWGLDEELREEGGRNYEDNGTYHTEPDPEPVQVVCAVVCCRSGDRGLSESKLEGPRCHRKGILRQQISGPLGVSLRDGDAACAVRAGRPRCVGAQNARNGGQISTGLASHVPPHVVARLKRTLRENLRLKKEGADLL